MILSAACATSSTPTETLKERKPRRMRMDPGNDSMDLGNDSINLSNACTN